MKRDVKLQPSNRPSVVATGELADSVLGRLPTVHIRSDRSTLAGRLHGIQVARRSIQRIRRIFRLRSQIRLRRLISRAFCRFSGKSFTYV